MNIYQKLHIIQKAVMGLSKDSKGQNYKYVSGTKVLSFLKPLMVEHGLLLKQEIVSIENERQNYLVGVTTSNPAGRPKSEILSKVMMKFTWIDIASGEKDENSFGANGQNDWDKGVGSALTYAERYFLLKYFHIATDEDDIDSMVREEARPAALEALAKDKTLKTKPQITDEQFTKAASFVVDKKTYDSVCSKYFLTSRQDEILFNQIKK